MSKSKIKLEELVEDIDKVLNLVHEVNDLDPESGDRDKILKKILKTNKELKKKYKDLDTKE